MPILYIVYSDAQILNFHRYYCCSVVPEYLNWNEFLLPNEAGESYNFLVHTSFLTAATHWMLRKGRKQVGSDPALGSPWILKQSFEVNYMLSWHSCVSMMRFYIVWKNVSFLFEVGCLIVSLCCMTKNSSCFFHLLKMEGSSCPGFCKQKSITGFDISAHRCSSLSLIVLLLVSFLYVVYFYPGLQVVFSAPVLQRLVWSLLQCTDESHCTPCARRHKSTSHIEPAWMLLCTW